MRGSEGKAGDSCRGLSPPPPLSVSSRAITCQDVPQAPLRVCASHPSATSKAGRRALASGCHGMVRSGAEVGEALRRWATRVMFSLSRRRKAPRSQRLHPRMSAPSASPGPPLGGKGRKGQEQGILRPGGFVGGVDVEVLTRPSPSALSRWIDRQGRGGGSAATTADLRPPPTRATVRGLQD